MTVRNFRKGDIVAIVKTTVTQPAFGSSKKPERTYSIRLARVESASHEGFVKTYRSYPNSPVYPLENRYGHLCVMTISGENQEAARRLFDAATYFLDFDDQEKAKDAIRNA